MIEGMLDIFGTCAITRRWSALCGVTAPNTVEHR